MRLRIGWLLPVVLLMPACANVLGYDDVTFDEATGGQAGVGGSSSGGGASGGGAGGAVGGAAGGGGSPSGGATNGGGGSPSGGGGSPSGGGGGSPSGGGGSPSGGGGSPSGGGGSPSGGGGSPSGGGGSPSGGGGSPSGGGGSPSGGGTGGSPTGHYETLTDPGGTGNEPGKLIPVCCVPSATEKASIDEVFSLLNQYRVSKGLGALANDAKLQATIEGHCHHMGVHTFFSHTAPESSISSPWTRANKCGTSANGENIAAGYGSPQAVMDGWKNSPGHNANMLGAGFKRVGIGKYGSYWGQIFGN